ncbi:hypothetical protein FH972_027301 [Carpinus fangiana]|uniref:Uncharacterized protein n=1 Tax=Carpinus fangiana TaxID=176857 RepID=A0A5N6M642_9ROSI|nr:hypothetical protein FH972_027301 [Carpinus fangiana]
MRAQAQEPEFWVVPDVFLLDSEEGSSPTSSSWEPKTGSALVALRKARVRASVTGLGDLIQDRLVHAMSGSLWRWFVNESTRLAGGSAGLAGVRMKFGTDGDEAKSKGLAEFTESWQARRSSVTAGLTSSHRVWVSVSRRGRQWWCWLGRRRRPDSVFHCPRRVRSWSVRGRVGAWTIKLGDPLSEVDSAVSGWCFEAVSPRKGRCREGDRYDNGDVGPRRTLQW